MQRNDALALRACPLEELAEHVSRLRASAIARLLFCCISHSSHFARGDDHDPRLERDLTVYRGSSRRDLGLKANRGSIDRIRRTDHNIRSHRQPSSVPPRSAGLGPVRSPRDPLGSRYCIRRSIGPWLRDARRSPGIRRQESSEINAEENERKYQTTERPTTTTA